MAVQTHTQQARIQPLHSPILPEQIGPPVRAYLPKCVLQKVDAGQAGNWLAELRVSSVLFVNLKVCCRTCL